MPAVIVGCGVTLALGYVGVLKIRQAVRLVAFRQSRGEIQDERQALGSWDGGRTLLIPRGDGRAGHLCAVLHRSQGATHDNPATERSANADTAGAAGHSDCKERKDQIEGKLLIVTHGMGHTLSMPRARARAELYASTDEHLTVLYYDWSGCGGSDGEQTPENLCLDLRTVLQSVPLPRPRLHPTHPLPNPPHCAPWVCSSYRGLTALAQTPLNSAVPPNCSYAESALGWPRHQILLLGQSMGTGPTLDLAASSESRGLVGAVLVHPFRSILATRFRSQLALTSLRLLNVDFFAADKKATACKIPMAVIHGRNDRTVPFQHGAHLAATLQAAGMLAGFVPIDGAGHGEMFETHPREVCVALCEIWRALDPRHSRI